MSSKRPKKSFKEDFLSRLARNKRHLISLAILFVMPLILYSAIFFGGKQYVGNDVLQWRAAAQSIKEFKKAHDGTNPLWETNMFSGMPAYTISQPKNVPNLDTLINALSGNAYPLLYFWVLLGGFYLFFIIQGLRPLAGVIGSISLGFTTYLPIIIAAGHYNQFVATAFLPWILTGYWLLSRTDRQWLGAFIFALATVLELRANHPQITYYFIYLLGFWWLFDTVVQYRRHQLTNWLYRTGILVGAGFIGIICSLEGYITLYQYSHYSTRAGSTLSAANGGGGLSLQYAFQWSQGFGELLTLIIPGIFGGASGEAYWGPKPFTSGPHYLGAIIFVLALVGILRYKKDIKWVFFGVGGLAMLFSLGYHFKLLNRLMFDYVPYFNKFRTPEMWLTISILCFSVLAVYGIHALFDLARDSRQSLQPLYVPLGIALGLSILFAVGYQSLLSFQKSGERQQYAAQIARQNNVSPSDPRVQQAVNQFINKNIKPKRVASARTDSIRFFVLVLLLCGLIVAFYKRRLSAGLFLAGLILLTVYDMLSIDGRYVQDKEMVSNHIQTEQVIQRQKKPADRYITQHNEANTPYPYRVYPLLDNPFNNAIPAYFYPTIGGYSGVKLNYYNDLIDTFFTNDRGNPTIKKSTLPILDMLNVKYITYNKNLQLPHMQPVFSQKKQVVMKNNNVLPKAFYVDSVATVSSPTAAVKAMQKPGFNPAKWAVVENNEQPAAQADSSAQVEVTKYQSNAITLTTNRKNTGFLVLSEIYYPAGWKAKIDGKSTSIYKTNFVLRGLEVPAGRHTITMRFEPATVYWGETMAWIGHVLLFMLLAMTVWGNYRPKK